MWEGVIKSIGEDLRTIREEWGLSLREVRERSANLAQQWNNRSFEISGSWLARLERGKHEMTVPKLITLATIYSKPADELLRHCHPAEYGRPLGEMFGPNSTLLVTGGPLNDQVRRMLPESFYGQAVPEETTLLAAENDLSVSPYRRAVIGRRDRTLDPMVRPGAILKIDTQQRAIASRREWNNEFDRPIYLLMVRTGYVCGWCELDKSGNWLTLVTHSLSHEPCQRWRYRKEVEVIGRAVAVTMRLTA